MTCSLTLAPIKLHSSVDRLISLLPTAALTTYFGYRTSLIIMDAKLAAFLLISVLIQGSTSQDPHELPVGITKCAISNEDCLRDGMNYVLKNHARTGIKQLGLLQLDPLHIKKFALGKNPNSPVSVDLTFTDAELLGLAEAQVKRVSPFTIDLAKPITFDMMSPKITLTGPYSVEGKVLILPIVGKGNATIVLDNCQVHAVVRLKAVPKGPNQTIAEVLEVKMRLDPSRVQYNLENLFNGRKDLSDAMHSLINENWKEIFNELKTDIATAMGLIFKSVLNRMLGRQPLEQLFSGI